jgi:hypothetical protein
MRDCRKGRQCASVGQNKRHHLDVHVNGRFMVFRHKIKARPIAILRSLLHHPKYAENFISWVRAVRVEVLAIKNSSSAAGQAYMSDTLYQILKALSR